MTKGTHDTQAMLGRLEALLASGVLTQAEVVSCAGLADALRRPARIVVMGQAARDVASVLRSLLGETDVSVTPDGPALQFVYGECVRHVATFEDGSSLSQDGYPRPDLMRYGPLFLEIEAPLEMLRTMSFLALELGEEPDVYAPALKWAAKRSEIAILCAQGFGDREATLWAAAPDRLKNHCYLVVTGAKDAASARARGLFDAAIHAPAGSGANAPLDALRHRLAADITAARQEDIDAAELFLHRFRRAEIDIAGGAGPSPANRPLRDAAADASPDHPPASEHPAPPAAPEPCRSDNAATPEPEARAEAGIASDGAQKDAVRALVSGPILHLKRRSRALAEILEWREETENWSEEVLEHCAATAEALRDLAAAWPDDDALAERLRDAIDQACDSVVLLQVEAGPAQAEDAARVLYQLRTDFEQAMAA